MKYIISFLLVIGLVVLVFVLILRGFSQRTPHAAATLLDYAKTNVVVQMTVDGPVNSEQNHRGYRVIVGRDKAVIDLTSGYEKTVSDHHEYANNEQGYGAFLRSLQLLGYTKGNPDPLKADERGYCPDGLRYIFEITKNGKTLQRYWSTSCGSVSGTFRGSAGKIRILFNRQIPDYAKVTRHLDINSF